MDVAKKNQTDKLITRETFKVTLIGDIPPNEGEYALPGRCVLAISSTEDSEVKYNARYIIGGHRDM